MKKEQRKTQRQQDNEDYQSDDSSEEEQLRNQGPGSQKKFQRSDSRDSQAGYGGDYNNDDDDNLPNNFEQMKLEFIDEDAEDMAESQFANNSSERNDMNISSTKEKARA